MVFYNSYLPNIASEDQRDRVSAYGWAMGYLGGGLLLVLNLVHVPVRRAARHLRGAGGAHQPGFRRRVVAGLLLHHLHHGCASATLPAAAARR